MMYAADTGKADQGARQNTDHHPHSPSFAKHQTKAVKNETTDGVAADKGTILAAFLDKYADLGEPLCATKLLYLRGT